MNSENKSIAIDVNNCPIRERTADGVSVGRCYYYLADGYLCPRHGNVREQVSEYKRTGKLQEDSRNQ